ncbi:unnamed protein product [Rotaria sp. Silwood1]|nr:unnamed protein product [Rotaria sp. Silwood1]
MTSIDCIKAKIPLHITIVGAGIAGLAAATACARAGMKVVVYEAATQLAEVGAGIQIGPNLSRLLRRWEILDLLQPQAVPLNALSLRRYDNDNELARVSMTRVEETHGAPIWIAHRADLQRVLIKGAEDYGARIQTGSFIDDIDFENARIKIKGCSQWLQSDVVIAADGVKSTIRKKLLALHGQVDQVRETGDAAWRAIVSAEKIYGTKDPSLIEALENPVGLRWMGPDGHIMGYPIRNHQLFNLVLLHSDKTGTEESWTMKGDKKEMMEFYKNWNIRVRNLLDLVPEGEVLEWKLCDHASLLTWIEGKVVLIGDAAHPMLPYVAQGASQAVEDGAVLAACLSMIVSTEQINIALKGTDTQKQAIEMWEHLVELVQSGREFESPFSTKNLPWLKKV